MSQNQHQSGSGNSNIPVKEVYWAMVAKADKKFSKIRDTINEPDMIHNFTRSSFLNSLSTFYQPSTGSGSGTGRNGARVNKDVTDPTLPPNPRKAILYRPSVTHFIAAMSGSEKGEPVATLLSPDISLLLPAVVLSRQHSGSFFTSFLTDPLQSLVLLLGLNSSDIEKDLYSKLEKLLQSSSNERGSLLAASGNLDPVWSQILSDHS